jgi:hypothetical protein
VLELDTSVFLIPGEVVKNREDRLQVMNWAARSGLDKVRGRAQAGAGACPKHRFGRRLRAVRVPPATCKVLLDHTNGNITTLYSAPELEELIEAANRVCEQKSGKIPALVVLKQKAAIDVNR